MSHSRIEPVPGRLSECRKASWTPNSRRSTATCAPSPARPRRLVPASCPPGILAAADWFVARTASPTTSAVARVATRAVPNRWRAVGVTTRACLLQARGGVGTATERLQAVSEPSQAAQANGARRSDRPGVPVVVRPPGTMTRCTPLRSQARVVVLAGPSGSGKSRLAEATGLPVLRLDDFYRSRRRPRAPADRPRRERRAGRLGRPPLVACGRGGPGDLRAGGHGSHGGTGLRHQPQRPERDPCRRPRRRATLRRRGDLRPGDRGGVRGAGTSSPRPCACASTRSSPSGGGSPATCASTASPRSSCCAAAGR